MSNSETVYTVQVNITKSQLLNIITILNKWEIDEEEDETLLTFEEVTSKPLLLKYICEDAVKGDGLVDPEESWNNDFWCDFRDYR